MSTSLPMGPNILHDPDEFHLMVTMDPTKEQLENRYYIAWRAKVAKYIRTLDLIKNKEADDEAVFKEFKKNIVSNLLALYKHGDVHEWREEAKLWYDGGNKVSRTWARRFKVSRFQIAGIIAAFSPQTEWFTNLGRAEFLGRAMSDKKILNHKFDAAQVAWGKVVIEKKKDGVKYYEARILPKMLRKIKGQSLKQLLKAGEISMAARAVRSYAEVYTNRRYTGWKPSGARMASVKTDKGEYGTLAWGGYGDIKKAIRMFQDGSDQSLSKNLGDAHKVRSFYNNIAHPDAPWGDVTMDTHAVAAGFWAPFSGSSKEVSANLTGSVAGGGGPGATKPHGMIGLYPIMADAYRTAAKRVGIQPREMQSITWEAIRGLFSADFKAEETKMEKAKKGSSLIRPVWKQYQDGKLTLAQARAKVYRLADGITAPKWHTDGLGTSGGGAAAGDVGSPGPGRARKSGKRSSGAGAKPARGDNAARSDTRGKSSRVKPRFAKAMPLKSPKFRRWFKDSAVVDEKGKPLVLYHGSPDPGTYPDPDRVLWGSRNEHHAWAYARAPRGTSRKEVHQAGEGISPVYMSIQAPFYSDALRENVSVDEFFDEMVKQGIATAEELKDYRDIVLDGADRLAPKWDRSHMSELMQRQPEPVMQYKVFQFWHNPEAVLGAEGADTLFAAMEKAGFDGIYHRELGNDTWGALGGIGRVKSATGNSGAWDETKPDTRHAKAMPPKSPEFKRWFKKSEAVQPDGKPLVVAHATNAKDDFEEFRTAGLGAHFGDAGAAAARQKQLTEFSERAVGRDAGTFRTITGYLSIQNALEMPDLAGVYQTSSGELIDADEVDERIDEFDTETPRPMAWEDETDFSEWLYINDHIDQEEFFEVQYDVDAAVALLKEQGYDGIKYENAVENPGSTTWIPFGSSQFKSTENSGEFSSETGKFRFAKAMPLKSPEFKRWFDESAAALPDGKPLPLYHGTTHAYTKYNDERGNVENYLGRGFYATTDPWDASHNYADPETSPDLTSRVELRTEEIWNDVGWFGDESDAEEQARAELMGGSPSVMQVYMSIQNPADLRPGGTTLTFDEKYDEELEEYVGEPTGTL
ncbi:MAG: hypothetical protein OSB57_15080, partial [Planctomycetota bacterium]|nr:hypothetical protein [Planctomycetota bacterium]